MTQDERNILKLAYQNVLSSYDGRKVLWDILNMSDAHMGTFTEDSNRMYFNEGRRHNSLELWKTIRREFPHAYYQMIKENDKCLMT